MTTNSIVLFDLDGTLADTPSIIIQTFERVLRCNGRAFNPTLIKKTIGQPLTKAFSDIVPAANAEEISHLCTVYRKQFSNELIHLSQDVLFPQTRPFLTRLQSQGIKIAIVTSKITQSAYELLDLTGIRHFFDGIYCHDMVPQGKPFPDLVNHALKTLGIERKNAVVVGDAIDDLNMAKNADVRGIGVTWGVSTESEIRANGFYSIVSDWPELENTLQSHVLR